jgi:hypothetical protein
MSPTMMSRHLSARASRARPPEAHSLELSPRETPAAHGAVPRGRRGGEGLGCRDVRAGGRWTVWSRGRQRSSRARANNGAAHGAVPRGRRGREGLGCRDVRAGGRWTVWPRGRHRSSRARANNGAARGAVPRGRRGREGTPDDSAVASLDSTRHERELRSPSSRGAPARVATARSRASTIVRVLVLDLGIRRRRRIRLRIGRCTRRRHHRHRRSVAR